MAQQTTTFPPGGLLQDWTPGFSSAGSPIRGIKIDNTSGSWLTLVVPGLTNQFIPPYTLGYTKALQTPINSVTLTSVGPPGSVSTTGGTSPTVYAYSDTLYDNPGYTYYTPSNDPIITRYTNNAVIAPLGNVALGLLAAPPAGQQWRLINFTATAEGALRQTVDCILFTGGFRLFQIELTPTSPTLPIPLLFSTPNQVDVNVLNLSSNYPCTIYVYLTAGLV